MKIADLSIQLTMDMIRLKADMDETKRVVSGAMKELESVIGFTKKALIGLTGIGGAAAFVGMVSSAIEARAKLYDLSLMSGITVEQLAALGKVAKYSDTSLQDVASGSNKLQKALATTNEDSKGAAQGIAALGLNFAQFKAQNPDQQMLTVANALARFEDGAGKTTVAMLLFGKAGASLLPFLKELSERGLQATKMTTESALAAKQYEDNLITLKDASDAWKKQMVSDLLPTLVNVTNQLVAGRQAYGGWVKAILDIGWNVDPMKTLNENARATTAELVTLQDKASRIKAEMASGSLNSKLFGGTLQNDLKGVMADITTAEQRLSYIRQQQQSGENGGRGKVNPGDPVKGKLDVKPPSTTDAAKDTFTPYIAAIRAKMAQEEEEAKLGRELTAGEKFRIAELEKLRNGTVKATDAQQLYAQNLLVELTAKERLNDQDKLELKIQADLRKESEQFIERQAQQLRGLEDTNRALAAQAEEYGLTAAQLEALNSTRLRAAAADLRARQLVETMNPMQAQLNELYSKQADQLERIAAARDTATARAKRDSEDPLLGADKGLRDYLEDVRKAGDATQQAVRSSLGGLEDVLTQMAVKGKGDARSLVDGLISEFVRLRIIRPLLSDVFGGGSSSGWAGLLGSVQGLLTGYGGSSTDPSAANYTNSFDRMDGSHAGGLDYVPFDGYRAELHRGERVQTAAEAQAARGGQALPALQVTNHIDARSDQAQVQAIVNRSVTAALQQFYAQLRADGKVS